ncbi:MAG: LIC_10190 family membrane protein [Deltaproteobacteria bacterium]
MIPSLFFFFIAWTALFFTFTGIGLTARRWLRCAPPEHIEDLFSCFWVGLSLAAFFAQIWHLLWPVNTASFLFVLAWGGWGMHSHARRARRTPPLTKKQKKAVAQTRPPRLGWSFYLPALGAAWLVSLYAAGLPTYYDAGLYYLPTMRWVTSFPVVPGLGNLHVRLAYNQTYFLYLGLLEAWTGRGTHLANSTFILISLLQFWISFLRVIKPVGRHRPVDIFQALMLPFVAYQISWLLLTSPSPDLAVMIIAVQATSLLLQLLENHEETAPRTSWLIYALFVLIVFGVTAKLTFLVYGGGVFLVLLVAIIRAHGAFPMLHVRRLAAGLGLTTFLCVVPWLIHGVLLTGWLVFPFPFGKFNVDWRLPTATLKDYSTAVMEYGHKTWRVFRGKFVYAGIPLILAAFALAANIVSFFRKRTLEAKPVMALLPLPCLLALIQWRVQVPNIRFGFAFFSILPALLMTLWVRDLRKPAKIVIVYLAVFATVLLYDNITHKDATQAMRRNRIISARLENVWRADKASWLVEQTYLPYVTHSKLMLFVPIKDDRCWDTDQICTPYPRRDLRLRVPHALRYGFRIEPFNEDDRSVGFAHNEVKPTLSEIPD